MSPIASLQRTPQPYPKTGSYPRLILSRFGFLLLTVALLSPLHTAFADTRTAPPVTLPYCIVDTAQAKCYDNRNEIVPPGPGESFYGQDAQIHIHPPSYTLGADGLTVHDNNTGLTWQRSPDTDGDGSPTRRDKLTFRQAQALPDKLNTARFGGFDDWRLPSIKQLYSLFNARGTDPSGPGNTDTSRLTPFIDTNFFKFAYGDPRTGERIIDSQYACPA